MYKIIDSVLDGAYLAASMVDYAACCATTSQDAAEALRSKFYQADELPLALTEITLFVLFSFVAKYYKDYTTEELHWLTSYIVHSWPYFRDFISGLKNGRHAVVSTGFLLNLGSPNLIYTWSNPIGIIVGLVLAFTLSWYRHMSILRNEWITKNYKLAECLSSESEIYRHSAWQRIVNLVASAFDGLTDGMYLYSCLFMLTTLGLTPSPGTPLFIAALIAISFITLTSFISKIHDEYLCQLELKASELQCEINLLRRDDSEEAGASRKEKKSLYTSITTPTDPHSFSFIGKLIFFTFRGTLSGAKNAAAAFDSIRDLINHSIVTLALTLLKISTAIGYALYLGGKSIEMEFRKRKISHRFNLFESASTYIRAGMPAFEYLRNDFV